MPERRKRPDVLTELRERLTEVVGIQLADDVMEVLADYEITRRGSANVINMVMGPPVNQSPGFSRWNLEEAYQQGLRRGRTGG